MIDRITPIHDRDDPRVAPYLNQKDAWLRAAHNPAQADAEGPEPRFMAEGALVVEHLLASPYPVESVLVSEPRAEALAGLLARVPPQVPIYRAARPVMASITGFDIHRGLLACGRRLPPPDPVELARSSRALVILEDLANHDNLGSIFRSAAVLGGRGVGIVLSPRCCDPLYRKALRVSMGHTLHLPFAWADEWPGFLARLPDLGFEVLALDPGPDAEPIDQAEPPSRPAMVFGAEGPGLSGPVRAAVGRFLTIPQAQGVDSLNIAVAAAVALHRLVRPS
ncbi:MAG: RNA methyltransferase [Phycisphaerales bacterium]|nr:RNA methyltransferase [Planctomycetota bacterium]MCH8509658.1 RNA methyltransferase [Phycisphaerales bacterium]